MKQTLPFLLALLCTQIATAQWEETNYAESIQVSDINFISEDIGYVAGYNELYKTSDGGDSWTLVVADPFINGPSLVHFINENIGFIAGMDGGSTIKIAKTINGGTSWTTSSFAGGGGSIGPNDFFFLDDNTGFMVDRSGVVLKTTNQGNTWTEASNIGSDEPKAIHFTSPSVGYMTLAYDSKVLKTINGGNSWSENDLGFVFGGNDIVFTDEQTGFIASTNTMVLRTIDAGATWTTSADFGGFDHFNAIAFTNNLTGYAVGQNGTLITTSDGGNNWTPSSSGSSDLLLDIEFVNDSVGYIGTYAFPSHVLKTTTGGGLVAIEESSTPSAFHVYPMISNGVYTIDCSIQDAYNIKVVDLKGATVHESAEMGKSDIDISGVKSGMYLLVIQQNSRQEVFRITKN